MWKWIYRSTTMGYVKKIKTQIPAIIMGVETNDGIAVRAIALQPAIAIAVVAAMARNFSTLENMVVC